MSRFHIPSHLNKMVVFTGKAVDNFIVSTCVISFVGTKKICTLKQETITGTAFLIFLLLSFKKKLNYFLTIFNVNLPHQLCVESRSVLINIQSVSAV